MQFNIVKYSIAYNVFVCTWISKGSGNYSINIVI